MKKKKLERKFKKGNCTYIGWKSGKIEKRIFFFGAMKRGFI
jgi:hypothetical protein